MLNRFAFDARKQKTPSDHQVWQPDNHPVFLYSPRAMWRNLQYIHNNPVVSGFVDQAVHYCLSSASNYANGPGLLDVTLLDDILNDTIYVDTGY